MKLIIFDFWHTSAYKSYRRSNIRSLWKKLGKKYTYRTFMKVYEKYFQLDKKTNFKEKYKKMFKELKLPFNEKIIKNFEKDRFGLGARFHFYIYLFPILKKLKKQGYKLAMLSNATYQEGEKIKSSKLKKYINHFFFSYDLKAIKPSLKCFKSILSHYKLKPSEVLMIGNTYEDDIKPAKKLGINTIHFKNSRKLKKELKNKGILR